MVSVFEMHQSHPPVSPFLLFKRKGDTGGEVNKTISKCRS
jgi:hypothetical protein